MGRPRGLGEQAVRLLKLLRRLESGENLHLYRLSEEFLVSERTIRRDVRILQIAGETVWFEYGTVCFSPVPRTSKGSGTVSVESQTPSSAD